MKKLFTFFKTLNNIFITVILTIFYFVVIGTISFFYRLFKREDKNPMSFWKKVDGVKLDPDYFNSPY